jgi:sensor histidine kinase YesM
MTTDFALPGLKMFMQSSSPITIPGMDKVALRSRLRQRIPHILVLGSAIAAMDELRLLPLDLDEGVLFNVFFGGMCVVIDSFLIALTLIFAITAAEFTPFAKRRRFLTLTIVVLVAAPLASVPAILTPLLGRSLEVGGLSLELSGVYFHILWLALAVGFLSAAYFTVVERGQQSAARLREAELERQGIERQVVESRLNVMKARVEPEFLFRSIGNIQQLYRKDIHAAERHLEDLIAYLRAALPQMRGGASTLGDELTLASTYLRLHDEAYAGGLDWTFAVDEQLHALHFPPMALLPLIDDALRRGASLDVPQLALAVRSTTRDGRLTVEVSDDCAVGRPDSGEELPLVAQQRAFSEFFGGGATVRREAGSGGTTVILEADFDIGARGSR